MSDKPTRVYVAGHTGMVGSAIVRAIQARGGCELVTRTSSELDLTEQVAVRDFFQAERPDRVYLAAARVGGIHANNTYPADFIHQNLMIQCNVVDSAHRADVQRLLFLGSSCIYPKHTGQPMGESSLLTGTLEPTNEPYAVAKIAGIKLCESYNRQHGRDYRSVMPTNLYGPGDNFHSENSHVIPGLLRRFHEAVEGGADSVTVWGTGSPLREFLHVDDLAMACTKVMDLSTDVYGSITAPTLSHLNVGTGVDYTIRELVDMVVEVTGFTGEIVWDHSKPDGTPRKLLAIDKLRMIGWSPSIGLEEGLAETYAWFLSNVDDLRV